MLSGFNQRTTWFLLVNDSADPFFRVVCQNQKRIPRLVPFPHCPSVIPFMACLVWPHQTYLHIIGFYAFNEAISSGHFCHIVQLKTVV
jgi:hypothetical protein